jgi:predicted metal-dependent HD superfamily phosphohydrolase
MSELEQRWPERLASRPDLHDRLAAAYAAPGRGYHDTRHLLEVLEHLDALFAQPEAGGADRDAVVIAAWFHDAVYDGRPDDEERSAALAEETLGTSDVPPTLTAEVARLVRLTRDHRPTRDDLHGRLLCDADLAILAAPRERYDEYVRDVRREYTRLDDATFHAGRARLLRELLEAPELFHTPLARRLWERPARANVERELASSTAAPGTTAPQEER